MKKVLFVITKSNWGGAQKYVFDLATSLPKDYQSVVAAGGSGPLIEKLRAAGVRTISLPNVKRDIQFFQEPKSLWDLYWIIRKERPDVVHVNSSKAGGLGALAARLALVPKIIYTIHGYAGTEPWRGPVQRALIWVATLATQILVHRSIALSEKYKKLVPLQYKTTTIHHGIHFLQTEPKPHEGIRIACVGELHPIKAHDVLIRAMQKVNGASLTIMGDGELREKLKALVANLKLESRVTLAGHVDNAVSRLNEYDIFTLPSLAEGLGYVLLEAGLSSLPVVASHVGGIPEIVEDTVSGILVPPGDENALAKALQALVDSPTERTRLGTALSSRIKNNFSIERMLQETIAVYEKNL